MYVGVEVVPTASLYTLTVLVRFVTLPVGTPVLSVQMSVADTVAFPAATPVTRPVDDTVAIVSSELAHVTV